MPRNHYVPAHQRESAKRQAIEDIIRWADRPRNQPSPYVVEQL